MNRLLDKWNQLPTEKKQVVKREIIDFFENERDEQIGQIAAQDLLEFFLKSVGKEVYNMGIGDAQKAIKQRMEELDFDLDDLQRL